MSITKCYDTLKFDYYQNIDKFLMLDDFLKHNKVMMKLIKNNIDFGNYYEIDIYERNCIRKVKSVLGKLVVTNDDFKLFLKNYKLIKNNKMKTMCTNYQELIDYIHKRVRSYLDSMILTERINELSFKFQGSIKDFEDEKTCGVCLEDYKNDQEVCRLPCDHFCCKACTENWFKIPQDGSPAKFQCPFCRDDCT